MCQDFGLNVYNLVYKTITEVFLTDETVSASLDVSHKGLLFQHHKRRCSKDGPG